MKIGLGLGLGLLLGQVTKINLGRRRGIKSSPGAVGGVEIELGFFLGQGTKLRGGGRSGMKVGLVLCFLLEKVTKINLGRGETG